jgi:fructose-bisphosphate aldolase class II
MPHDSYDTSSCLAVIRAAERTQSPAMILLFPATLRQFGLPFLKFILDLARSSTVPIAVHLDHATTAEDIDLVLTWAEQSSEKEREAVFDSIMIDASHAPTDSENLSLIIPHIPVEVELGRLEGGEAGLRVIESGGQELTDPKRAERFMNESGAVVLAPSIGNLHGKYLREPDFRLDM